MSIEAATKINLYFIRYRTTRAVDKEKPGLGGGVSKWLQYFELLIIALQGSCLKKMNMYSLKAVNVKWGCFANSAIPTGKWIFQKKCRIVNSKTGIENHCESIAKC